MRADRAGKETGKPASRQAGRACCRSAARAGAAPGPRWSSQTWGRWASAGLRWPRWPRTPTPPLQPSRRTPSRTRRRSPGGGMARRSGWVGVGGGAAFEAPAPAPATAGFTGGRGGCSWQLCQAERLTGGYGIRALVSLQAAGAWAWRQGRRLRAGSGPGRRGGGPQKSGLWVLTLGPSPKPE